MPVDLKEFARRKRREATRKDCTVCKISQKLQQEIREAKSKEIRYPVVAAWLKEVHGINVSVTALTQHAYHTRTSA